MCARRVPRRSTPTGRSRRCDSTPTASTRSRASSALVRWGSCGHRWRWACRTTARLPRFKFLLDGPHPSQNLLVHQSLDKQASRDFFERAPTNHTLEPGTLPEHPHAAAPQVLALADLAPDRAATSGSSGGGDERRDRGRAGAARRNWCTCTAPMRSATTLRRPRTSGRSWPSIPAETPLYRMYGKASPSGREGLHRVDHARVALRRFGVRGSHPGLPARLAGS